MLSYLNNHAVKDKYIARFAAHRVADEVIQGQGFQNGRGCFVGCTLDAYDHERFPIELGWPEWLAHLADSIFESLPMHRAPRFGTDLLEAIPVGVNLEPVRSRFLLTVQRRNLVRMEANTDESAPEVIAAIKTAIGLLEKDEPASSAAWSAAWSVAESAAASASSAAWSAAWSVAESAAASARSAARSAASSAAWSAAYSAARSAARSAASSAAWSAELSAVNSAAQYKLMRDDLLDICRELKPA